MFKITFVSSVPQAASEDYKFSYHYNQKEQMLEYFFGSTKKEYVFGFSKFDEREV